MQNTKLLTIEDDATVRANIVAFFEDNGYQMLEAPNGQLGIEMFLGHAPDVVLCDLRMPDMDGLEVLDRIRQTAPDTPVIIVSGAGMISDAVQALKLGAWDYVIKPIPDMQVLVAAVEKAVDKARLILENREYQRDLERLNRELGQALEQIKADQRAGREVQSRLLPKDDQRLGGFVFRRRLYPAAYLSGDFVDYFPINSRYIGFYIADVSGHDTGSAFVTVIVKILMNQLVDALAMDNDETILDPAQTLARMNADLCGKDLNKYVTIFYGVIDTIENRINASSGGQFPYPILVDSQAVRQLSLKGRPVGLFEDVQFPSKEIELPRDFMLLLLSDGMFELMPDKSNEEQTADLISLLSQQGSAFDYVTQGIGSRGRSELSDDVTMLAISRSQAHAG